MIGGMIARIGSAHLVVEALDWMLNRALGALVVLVALKWQSYHLSNSVIYFR